MASGLMKLAVTGICADESSVMQRSLAAGLVGLTAAQSMTQRRHPRWRRQRCDRRGWLRRVVEVDLWQLLERFVARSPRTLPPPESRIRSFRSSRSLDSLRDSMRPHHRASVDVEAGLIRQD